jgi:hypothetical protein
LDDWQNAALESVYCMAIVTVLDATPLIDIVTGTAAPGATPAGTVTLT